MSVLVLNPFLKKLGFGPADRVLITHIDDIGFSHAANLAAFECLDVGAASCGSILVNGPWFQEAIELCRQRPWVDVGIHLTLTCEYPTFRWAALSTRDPASGLLDEQGYLWRTREDAIRHVSVESARAEMRAQIEAALATDVAFTHIDTHMGSVVHPKFLPDYLALADEYGLPAFLPRMTQARLAEIDRASMAKDYLAVLDKVDADAVPVLDDIIIDTLNGLPDKTDYYRGLIDGLKPGLTHLLFHPARSSDELMAIDQQRPLSRHADYLAWRDPALKDYIQAAGIHQIGYRQLQAQL